jgi:psp operon transcriptional activator
MQSPTDHGLIGSSQALSEALARVSKVAPLDRPVLVIGERGTGKELVAARLHYLSKRWDRSFIKLNCAALAESILESELFGYEAGAFTGATKRHLGRFELAHGGTLFLDELATCSLRVQEKILRVVEYGEFERLGGRDTIKVDVRLLGATNSDLPKLARCGQFREDLLDRLAFDVITLPPLRVRTDDVIELAEHFALKMTQELGREVFQGFSTRARAALRDYAWPGNVRELKNVIERAVYRCEQEVIDTFEFDPFQSPWRSLAPAVDRTASEQRGINETSEYPELPFEEAVAQFEVSRIKAAMQQARFNQRKASELLGLSYHQLRGYLKKYKLFPAQEASE